MSPSVRWRTCRACGHRTPNPKLAACPVCKEKLARPSKYHNESVTIDGIRFDSRHESTVYQQLKARQDAGEIVGLTCHPIYRFKFNGVVIGSFRPDFRFLENSVIVLWDAKGGALTTDYKLRKRLLRAFYGLEVLEIYARPMKGKRP